MPSSTIENYLKAIYSISDHSGNDLVSMGTIAERLQVTAGSVTTMMRALSDQKLLEYEARKGVKLTELGRTAALRVLRRHRLIETYLVRELEMDWAEVHEDAEAMEHVISDRLVARMDEVLGYPDRDPHGAPIPSAASEMPENLSRPLSDLEPGRLRMVQVKGEDPSFLGWLDSIGLRPGIEFQLLESNQHAGVQQIRIDGNEHALGMESAARIFVAES